MARRRPLLNVLLRLGYAPGLALLLAASAFVVQAPELVAAAGIGCVTPGANGPNATLTGVVNSYYPATASAALGATSISVGARTPGASPAIAPGELLLVIQMQDADIQGSNTIAYGDGATGRGSTALRSTGLYEYVRATSAVVAGTVNIAGTGGGGGLVNAYDFTAVITATNGVRTFQVIRVPQYSSATVTPGLTASAWDGTTTHTGGVLAIDVAGALNLNGQTISVNQLGFKGGLGVIQTGPLNGDTGTDYVVASLRGHHGYKAEGIAGTPRFLYDAVANAAVAAAADGYPSGDAARGAPGNAGGGGADANPVINDQNTGGGGGSDGGQGGLGGNSWNTNQPVGGLGGASFPATATSVVLGGGGGAGSRNNSAGFASSGGTGGGIVMIRAGSLSGAGTISANGGVGVTPDNDGGGGGGAGGSVIVTANAVAVNTLTIHADGGRGTDAWPADAGGAIDRHGPGGGGAGGVIFTANVVPLAQTVLGGAHGVTTTLSDAYGSTDGGAGFTVTTTLGAIPGSSSGAECVPALTTAKSTTTPTVTNTSSGTTATYSITVSNSAGVAPATSVNISDVLPAGFSFAASGGAVLNGGATRPATINPTLGDTSPAFGTFSIPAGGSVVITFTVNIASSVVPGTYSNPATATYLDPARTVALGTTSAGYAGGGAERVTVLPLLPNTAGVLDGAGGSAGAMPPDGGSGAWLAMVTLIVGAGALGLAVLGVTGGGPRLRQRRGQLAGGMLAVLVCFVLGPPAVGQFAGQPADGTALSSAFWSAPDSVLTQPTTALELAGRTLATTAPAAQIAAPSFHLATGPITPSRLKIPSIGVDALVDEAGILPDGSMGVPNSLWTSSWLSTGPRPGQAGSSVIAGHRGIGTPALFSHLENVQQGDRIYVSDAAGGELLYEVTRVASLDLSAATQFEVFGPTARQQLVLVTCFGAYSRSTHTYDHRLVVFSRLVTHS
ncbi:MAG TPA: sortase [Candidatus Dormibacteraeota bacterium]|nr:sortase [Candidatus Dormibacteraeota bacterium]